MNEDTEERIRTVYRETAPYLSDLEKSLELIGEAFRSGDPEQYLEELLDPDNGLNKADIRIILNRLRKKKVST